LGCIHLRLTCWIGELRVANRRQCRSLSTRKEKEVDFNDRARALRTPSTARCRRKNASLYCQPRRIFRLACRYGQKGTDMGARPGIGSLGRIQPRSQTPAILCLNSNSAHESYSRANYYYTVPQTARFVGDQAAARRYFSDPQRL